MAMASDEFFYHRPPDTDRLQPAARGNPCKVQTHHVGQVEPARAAGELFLKEWPEFSIHRWADTEPNQNPRDRQHYVDALTMAGLPP